MDNEIASYFNGTYVRELLKDFTGLEYFNDFIDTYMSMFSYENLPIGLESRDVEIALFFKTNLCFYFSEGLNRVVFCYYVPTNTYNEYMHPVKVNLIAFNGTVLETNYNYSDIVPIRDNTFGIPAFVSLKNKILKLATMDGTIDINMFLLRLPAVFEGNKEQANQLNNLYKAVNGFKIAIAGNKNTTNIIKQFDIKIPYSPNELLLARKNLRGIILTSMGINCDESKKERMLQAEAENQNAFSENIYEKRLNARKQAINEVNKRWGLNIVIKELKANEQAILKEGVNNDNSNGLTNNTDNENV